MTTLLLPPPSSSSSPFPHLSPRSISQRSLPSSSNTGNAYKKLKCFFHPQTALFSYTSYKYPFRLAFFFICLIFSPFYMGEGVRSGPTSLAPPDPKGRLLPLRRSEKEKGESSDLKKTKKNGSNKKRQNKGFLFLWSGS